MAHLIPLKMPRGGILLNLINNTYVYQIFILLISCMIFLRIKSELSMNKNFCGIGLWPMYILDATTLRHCAPKFSSSSWSD